jgi:hypothetical protein
MWEIFSINFAQYKYSSTHGIIFLSNEDFAQSELHEKISVVLRFFNHLEIVKHVEIPIFREYLLGIF